MVSGRTEKEGSVLLLTLLVITLLLGVVLSFTVYVRLELRRVTNRQDQEQARHHARLSMHLALAQLQRTAGPDRRVTASAAFLSSPAASPHARHWTGVWERNPAGGVLPSPVWLVSGNNPSPLQNAPSPSIPLFPEAGPDPAVQVPLVALQQNSGRGGHYAYWVSGAADKASFSTRRNSIRTYESAPLKPSRRLWEYQTDFGIDLAPFFDGAVLDLTDVFTAGTFDKVSGLRDMLLFEDSANRLLVPADGGKIQDLYHHITPASFGVLENPVDGGLKKNLSDPDFRDSFLATDETQQFLAAKPSSLEVENGEVPSGISPGDPYFSPRPLLSEVVLYMGIFHTHSPHSDQRLRIRFHVEAEFINPYTQPLRFVADNSSTRDRAVVMVFENMPTITVEDTTPGSPAPSVTEDLNQLSAYNTTDTRQYIHSWVEINADGTPNIPVLNPGEIYQVMEPNPQIQSEGLARFLGSVTWKTKDGTQPHPDADIKISAKHPPGGITIKMVPYAGSGSLRDRDPIAVYKGLIFDDFEIIKPFDTGPNPFSRSTSGSYVQQDYIIAYHFRLLSDVTDITAAGDVLTGHDFRDPVFDAAGLFENLEGNTVKKTTLLDPSYSDPSFIVQDPTNLFSKLDLFADGTGRSHKSDYTPSLWFDIPDSNVLSVGQLSHLHLYRKPPRLIGSPRGGIYNAAFDRYYFSPKITSLSLSGPVVANPAIGVLQRPEPSANENDAAVEMIAGQFNINSTSEKAWEALLTAPVLTPAARDETDAGEKARRATFFSLPLYASTGQDFDVTDAELAKPENAFSQGIRSLHGPDGLQQAKALAAGVAQRIRDRSEPFADVRSFVNSGILQEAIDAQNGINDGLFVHSNVYLTQNHLLTKLAPVLAPRSDTFTIRAYGSVTTPSGDVTSEAVCEAVVMRLPEKTDGSDPIAPSETVLDARRFKIMSFRWLTDEEI